MNRFLRAATLVFFAVHGVLALAAPPPLTCPTISLAPTSLPNGDLATAYTPTVTSSGGTAPVVIDITHGVLPNGVNLTDNGNGSATFSGTATQTGNFEFTITATDANGCSGGRTYAPTFATASQTITFTSTAPAAATVGGPTYTVTATATSGLPVTFTIDATASGVCSIAGSTVSFIGVGTCVIDANQAGNASYGPAPQVQQSFAVAQGSQTITFTSTAPAAATVGGATYNVTATATSGLPVAFTIDATASSICSIAGSTVSFTAVGTCVIDANQAGNANYSPAPQVQQSFAVGQGSQTITFTSTAPAAASVGGPTYNVTATGGASGNPVTFTIDATATSVCSIAGSTVSFIAAGTCVIDANQAGNANYTAAPQVQQSFAVGKASQTITFTSTAPAGAVVGGATYNVTATGGASGNPVTFTIDASASTVCTIAASTVSFIGAGTCVIDANQAGNANYNAAPQVQQSFVVGKGTQTITFTSPAPVGATVGGATYNVTATGGASGNPVTFTIDATASTVCTIAGSTVSFIGAGTCVIDADQAGNANYNAATQAQQSFAVGKGSQTITFTSVPPATPTVGGATYNVTATGGASGNAVTFTIDATATSVCSIAGSTVSFIGNGTCVIDANQAGNANYNAAPQVQQSFTVKSSQTITFTSSPPATPTVGGATYTVTATATSGLPVTFTIDATATSVCSIAGSTVSFTAAGTCVIDANQAGNGSFYAAPQVQQSFTVKNGQTITFTSTAPANATYLGPTYTVTATATSGLPVTFTIDATATSVCSIAGATVSFIGTGVCVIDANQAGNASFYPAPQVQQSFGVHPGAVNDPYTALGNVLVDSSTGPGTPFSVTDNDTFPAGTTISAFDATSVNLGTVTMVQAAGATMGRFTYNPPVGFTGNDSFTYTLSSNGQTAVGTVTFTVTGKVWFINDNAGACPAAPCNGRQTNPFTDTSTFQAVNNGTAGHPAASDPIFVFSSATNYSGAITLLNGQRLIGQAAVSSLAALATVTAQNGQVLPTTGGTAPVLTSGGTTVTTGSGNFIHGLTFGTGTNALVGTGFGTLTVSENVTINNTAGRAMNLTTGTLAATFLSITSTGSATQGIALTSVGGSLTSGAVTVSTPTGNGIDVQSSAATINVGNTTVTKVAAGTGVNLGGAGTGNSGAITFANLGITTSAGAALVGTENTGTVTVTNNTANISATGGSAINITKPAAPLSPIALNLGTVSSATSPSQGINLLRTSGTLTTTGGSLATAALSTLSIASGTTSVTYPGTITQATAGQRVVDVQNNTGGTIALSGLVTSNTANGTGVILSANTGATISFSGGITLSTAGNDAFTATGGGIVNVSATNNITTTGGRGLNWAVDTSTSGVTINNVTSTSGAAVVIATSGASNFTFNDITSTTGTAINVNTSTGIFTIHAINAGTAGSGPARGVTVNNLTGAGSFTVNGTGTTAGSGGTIQRATGNGMEFLNTVNVTLKNMNLTGNGTAQTVPGSDATCGGNLHTGNNLACVANLYIKDTNNVSLDRLAITNGGQIGLNGNNITHFALTNCSVTGNGNEAFESGVMLQNLLGTGASSNLIQDCNIRDNAARQIQVDSAAGSTQLDVNKTTGTMYMGNTNRPPSGGTSQQGLLVDVNNTFTLNVDQVTVKNNVNNGVDFLGRSGAVLSGHVNNSVFDINGAAVDLQTIGGNTTFDVTNNTQMTGNSVQAINVANGAGATGTLLSKITGNTIGIFNNATGASACDPTAPTPQLNCTGISISEFGGTVKATVSGNQMHQISGTGMNVTASGGTTAVTISGNTIDQPGNLPIGNVNAPAGNAVGSAVLVNMGSLAAVTACGDIVTNMISAADFFGTGFGWDPNGAGTAILVRTRNGSVTSIPNLTGGTAVANVASYIQAHQTSGGTTTAQAQTAGIYAVGGANCGTP
jgi:hypothetical protein